MMQLFYAQIKPALCVIDRNGGMGGADTQGQPLRWQD
jgi:hypothetical protein